jgi:DNA-binding transcriptional MerR regulator
MSNERLIAFKERVKTDPEYKEYLNQRHRDRMQNDPEYRARKQANWRRKDSKRKALKLNTPEALANHQQIKLNQLRLSIMDANQRKALRRKQKTESYRRFYKKHGIKYATFIKWKKRSGLTDIREIIEYRNNYLSNKKGHCIANLSDRNAKFYKKYGITEWVWKNQYKPKGFTLKQIAKIKSESELKEIVRVNESLLAPKLQYVPMQNIGTTQKRTKQEAFTELQRKISNLNCTIWDSAIRENAINRIQQQFYQEWGAV